MSLRLIAYGLMALLIVVGALLLSSSLRGASGASEARVGDVPAVPGQAASAATLPTPAPSAAQAVRVLDQTASAAGQTRPLPTSLRPESIRLSDVTEIALNGSEQVLVFHDGSRLPVTAVLRSQLPADLQVRLSYSREH